MILAIFVCYYLECGSDDIFFLYSKPGFSIPQKMLNFSIGFWINAENKLCDQQKFMILTYFAHQDNLHKSDEIEA